MDKKKVSLKGRFDQNMAVSYLEDLVRSFKEGTVCVQHGAEFVSLKPSDSVEFEIEANQKKGKEELNLQLSWKIPQEEGQEENQEFKISSSEPVCPPEPCGKGGA